MKEIPLIAAIATLVFVLGLIIGEHYAHEKFGHSVEKQEPQP